MALWIIAVLSVMVLSFATEAHLQTGINVYVRERNRVNRLMDAGRVLGEVVLAGYEDAKEWSDGEDIEELLEEDRWCMEKRSLKYESKCKIGPILLDEEDPDSGTVTVEISLANSGDKNGINVNELYSGGDQNYALRWQMILQGSGLNQELEVEMDDHEGGRKNLMNVLIASWNDWRDDDDNVSTSPLEDGMGDDGAESTWYEEEDEHDEVDEEDRRRPRNGSIPDVQELAYVRGFRDFPAVLTGGLLYPDRDESPENPRLKGIVGIFGTIGGTKVNVNDCTVEQLLTVPGIYNEDDPEDQLEAEEVARAIVETLKEMPDYDVDESRSWWPYKDWQDLCTRVSEAYDVEIGNDANQYLCYQPESTSVFKMKITGSSMGMKREVNCECYVKDKKVRYIKWRED
ncbi:MAG: hypothetical protein IKL85_10305 [Lentisphaeria bacterium]|nr:hypothetical protein [Lentisphaeria bacterium]